MSFACNLATSLGQHGSHAQDPSREHQGGGESELRDHLPQSKRKTTAVQFGGTGQVPERGTVYCTIGY